MGTSNTNAHVRAPPWWVVTLVLGFGLVFVGGTTYGGVRLMAPRASSPVATTPGESPRLNPANNVLRGDWRAALTSTACSAPCAGGVTCAAKPTPCTSGLTCIPGLGPERFER